jgi:protein SCO1/2
MKRFAFLGIGVILGLAIVLAAWFIAEQNYTYQGVLIDPPAKAGDFTLTDQNGNPFRLSEQYGKVVLIFFGYTNCPDVCPITMSDFKNIKAGLGDKAADVRFVFITVDPERDTPQRLQAFLSAFDPDFIGLTGDTTVLQPVWKSYGVFVQREDVDSAIGYLVDHSARTYVIDRNGQWRLNYPFGMETEKMTQDILHLLRAK